MLGAAAAFFVPFAEGGSAAAGFSVVADWTPFGAVPFGVEPFGAAEVGVTPFGEACLESDRDSPLTLS